MSVDWSYYNSENIDKINDKYLPAQGQGNSLATQIVTCVNKLVYKWYNDGDVYDNTYHLSGWANDLSSYANWLYKHADGAADILAEITHVTTEGEYEDLLRNLVDLLLDMEKLDSLAKDPIEDNIYKCDGPFCFVEESEDEDDYDEEYDEDEE